MNEFFRVLKEEWKFYVMVLIVSGILIGMGYALGYGNGYAEGWVDCLNGGCEKFSNIFDRGVPSNVPGNIR